jgi:hypothetical protein
MVRPERARDRTAFGVPSPSILWLFRTFHLPPLQDATPWTGFPGLKPRAESSRPLRGEEASQILLIFVPFNPGFSPISANLLP